MGRVSFTQVASLPDILDSVAYEMLFGTIPGVGNAKGLNLRSKDTNIPGYSNESFNATIHGHTRTFRGRITFSNTWSTTFFETVDGFMLSTARAWHERVVGSTSGNSKGYLKDYSVDVQLIVYDTAGNVTKRATIEEVYPQDVSDIQLSGESSQAMNMPITWKYSRCIWDTSL